MAPVHRSPWWSPWRSRPWRRWQSWAGSPALSAAEFQKKSIHIQRTAEPTERLLLCAAAGRHHLYGALVVVGHIQEHGVCDGGHQWAETGLDEGSDRLAPVAVHQSTLLVAVARRHGLCAQGDRPAAVTSHTQPVGVSVTRQQQASQCYMHLDH